MSRDKLPPLPLPGGQAVVVLVGGLLAACLTLQPSCFAGRGISSEISGGTTFALAPNDEAGIQAIQPQQANSAAPPPAAAPAPARVTFIGRTLGTDPLDPDSVRIAWSGVSAGVRFRGSTISVSLGDAAVPPAKSVASIFDVVVDGNRLAPVCVAGEARSYLLAQGLDDGEHTLWLTKRTDCNIGAALLRGFALGPNDSLLAPPARPARHLMVVGASSEVGFGVTGNDQNCATGAIFVENQSLAWPQLTANQLGADLENLAISSRGLLGTAGGPVDANHHFIDLFLQSDPFIINRPWDIGAGPAMDAVMFNLGSNDWHLYGDGPPPAAKFEAAFVAFAQRVWTAYPQAHIYLTLVATAAGDERATFAAYLQDIVATLRGQGQANIHYLAFTPAAGLACWGHPDPALHRQMAAEMAAQIASDLGWPGVPPPAQEN